MAITVREIDSGQHQAFVAERGATASVSFLQTPAWAGVKSEIARWGKVIKDAGVPPGQ